MTNTIADYWERQPTDVPYYLNGFNGTWNFTEHKKVPEGLRNFLLEMFPKAEKFKQIPIEDINVLMNEVWEGPGSMVKLSKMYLESYQARTAPMIEDSKKK